ncbi:hypothetical protein PybrP1_001836 [[Pythium] brassicae (nom. inval.)]|nr:hypothetical protein PybrP1_001836 [[Pythium] brassicae (nom. inval.)]
MTSRGFRLESDGDVDMSVPQPVYEFISAPKLSSVKSSCTVEILAILARYELKMAQADIKDEHLTALFSERCSKLKNAHVPDIALFFRERLRMNLREDDSDARILQYFADFDQLVKDNGFASILGTGSSSVPLKKRMKQRCSILMNCIQPEMLKVEIKRLSEAGHHDVLSDDVKLYELIRERAALQQHYHTLSVEFKRKDVKPQSRKPEAPKRSEKPRPTGAHWLRDCPVASQEQKDEALAKMRDVRGARNERVRRLIVADGNGGLTAKVNDLIELTKPVVVEFADGRRATCQVEAMVDLEITTAAGLVHVRAVKCLVLDSPSNEFLLGRVTMKT